MLHQINMCMILWIELWAHESGFTHFCRENTPVVFTRFWGKILNSNFCLCKKIDIMKLWFPDDPICQLRRSYLWGKICNPWRPWRDPKGSLILTKFGGSSSHFSFEHFYIVEFHSAKRQNCIGPRSKIVMWHYLPMPCSYPHVNVSIRDFSQILTTAPIFLYSNYFRQKYLEIASCAVSLLNNIWVRVEHSLLQQPNLKENQLQFKQFAGMMWIKL